jgi:predicted RNA-binding protein YlxR (DUF448 family)/ribosomal protein L7Ae-like RNA K-turn-binding protein
MIAANSEFPEKPESGAHGAFTDARDRLSAAPLSPHVPFDTAIGQQVAKQVIGNGVSSRVAGTGATVDAAAVGMEPEEVGGKGSRQRRCIVTGEVLAHELMIRFVISPDGIVTPDLEESLPGRGYWVTARHAELMKAVVNDTFSRAAQRKVIVPAALIDQIIVLARRACLSTLGLARRSWQIDFGYEPVREALMLKKAGVLLIARNAPGEIQHRLDHVRGDVPVVDLFNTAELSAALGRESLVFAAVTKGQWTMRFLIECNRLAQLLAR